MSTTQQPDEAAHPYPDPDELTRPFWEGTARGELSIQRCGDCRRYHYPPVDACFTCGGTGLSHDPVSGSAQVHSWTSTEAGARHPYWGARAPYLVGLVRLAEQDDLLLYTNFPGAEPDDMSVGREVRVQFERLPGGQALPQFVPADGSWSRSSTAPLEENR